MQTSNRSDETDLESTSGKPLGMRTFVIIWLGELLSTLGSGLTSFALGVWVFDRTREVMPFALIMLCSYLPSILISPIAGVLADRWNRRRLMLLADTGDALVTLLIVGLLAIGRLEVWHVYLIAAVSAVFATFQELAYTAAVTMLVPKKDLARAGGLMQMGQALETISSPLLAGILFMAIGLERIIFIDFVTYFFAISALLIVRIPIPKVSTFENAIQKSVLKDVLYGWGYLRSRSGLLGLALFFIPVNFLLNFPAVLITPLVLSFGTPAELGTVNTVGGIGMLLGSIFLGVWGGPKRRVGALIGFVALSSFGLFLIGLRPSTILISAGLFIILFSVPLAAGLNQAIFQTKVAADVQGRVFAVRTVLSRSMLPLTYVTAGLLADRLFEPLMRQNGVLSNTSLGTMIRVGPGRGIGLMFVISAIALIIVCILAFATSTIRLIDDDLSEAKIEPNLGVN
jgi:DHA3 family macrolide efflux protein-like MFS transporter